MGTQARVHVATAPGWSHRGRLLAEACFDQHALHLLVTALGQFDAALFLIEGEVAFCSSTSGVSLGISRLMAL